MKINRTPRIARLALGLGVAAVLGLGSTLPAFADGPTSVTISGTPATGGGVTLRNFSAISLDGVNQKTATATWSIANVTDASGSGNGWNVSLTLPALATYDTTNHVYFTGGSAHTLASSSIQVTTAPVVTQVGATGSPASTVTPVAAGTALDTGSAVTLLSARVNGGMGSYSFSDLTATLTVPATTFAATYRSDATVSFTATP